MKAPLYPSEDLRKRLEELGVPRDKHNLAELGEMLPRRLKLTRVDNGCFIKLIGTGYDEIFANTEANARSKMLIYLKEKG